MLPLKTYVERGLQAVLIVIFFPELVLLAQSDLLTRVDPANRKCKRWKAVRLCVVPDGYSVNIFVTNTK